MNRSSLACAPPESFLNWRRLPPKNVARVLVLIALCGLLALIALFVFYRRRRAGRLAKALASSNGVATTKAKKD